LKKKTACESGSGERQNKERIDEFISSVAAPNPIPAGGSAAALAGALAAALGEMTAGLTEGREKFACVQPQVQEIHAKLTLLRKTLRGLVQEDSMSFKSLLNAIKLPKETGEQRSARAEAIEKTTRSATETPLRTARAAIEVLENLNALIEIGNPNARCDVAAGAQLAYAALKSGQYNVLANIQNLKDLSFTRNCCAEISDLVRRGQKILERLDRLVSVS
jgi:formiminotetrahydrofolate cyclodeaminase